MYILAKIKEKLEVSKLELFRSSYFVYFLNLDTSWTKGGKLAKKNTFARQYVHFFMLQCMPTVKKHVLWFLVEGKLARFSIDEFTVVTGLICTPKSTLSL